MDNEFGWFVKDARFKVCKDGKNPSVQQFKSGNGFSARCSYGFKSKDTDGNEKWSNLFVKVMITAKTENSFPLTVGDSFKAWGRPSYEEREWDGNVYKEWTLWTDRIEPLEHTQQRPQFDGGDQIPF